MKEIVIKISDVDYERLIASNGFSPTALKGFCEAVKNGKVLPEGHKRLIEDNFEVGPVFGVEGDLIGYLYVTQEDLNNAQTIIEADKEYGVEIITHGNCMMCGKELTNGLFFCPECEAKQKARTDD